MTAGETFRNLIRDNWEPFAPGRRHSLPELRVDPDTGSGVIVQKNLDDLRNRLQVHDVIQVRHLGRSYTDKGFDEEGVTDELQVDIRAADRDTDGDGVRDDSETRVLGALDRDDEPSVLGGLEGEVKRILNTVRRGHKHYDKVTHDVLDIDIQNTDVRVVMQIEAEVIARNVQTP